MGRREPLTKEERERICRARLERKPRPPQCPPPPRATGVHEIWQLDTQVGIRLADGTIASICNIRDPGGGGHWGDTKRSRCCGLTGY